MLKKHLILCLAHILLIGLCLSGVVNAGSPPPCGRGFYSGRADMLAQYGAWASSVTFCGPSSVSRRRCYRYAGSYPDATICTNLPDCSYCSGYTIPYFDAPSTGAYVTYVTDANPCTNPASIKNCFSLKDLPQQCEYPSTEQTDATVTLSLGSNPVSVKKDVPLYLEAKQKQPINSLLQTREFNTRELPVDAQPQLGYTYGIRVTNTTGEWGNYTASIYCDGVDQGSAIMIPGNNITCPFNTTLELYIPGETDASSSSSSNSYLIPTADLEIIKLKTDPIISEAPITVLLIKNNKSSYFKADDFTAHYSDAYDSSLAKIKITSLPSYGTLIYNGDPVVLGGVGSEISIKQIGGLIYVPTTDWYGKDGFGWNGSDGRVYAAKDGTVSITITDYTTMSNFTKQIPKNLTGQFTISDFTGHFTAVNNGSLVKVKIVSFPRYGHLKLSGVNIATNQEINAEELDNLTYVPVQNWTGNDDFVWTGFDGLCYPEPSTASFVTLEVKQGLFVSNISKQISINTDIPFMLAEFKNKFFDPDNITLSKVKITSLPQYGTLKFSGSSVVAGQEIDAVDLGNLVYTPDINWAGNDIFNWKGSNGVSYSPNEAVVNIAVSNVTSGASSIGPLDFLKFIWQ